MNAIFNLKNIPTLITGIILLITGPILSQTGAGTAITANGQRIVSASDTVFEYAETFYIGPAAQWEIAGVLVIYSKNVWIAPSAKITGTGKLIIAAPGSNPLYTGTAPTIIDGNNGNYITLNIEHKNPANILLSDISDPGYNVENPTYEKAAALNIGADFSFEADGADVLLNGNDFLFNENATIRNFSAQRMVVTNNTVNGHLIKQNSNPETFDFPIGIAEGDYTPASITGSNTYYVSVTDYSFIDSFITAPEKGMDRAWHIYGGTANSMTLQHNSSLTDGSHYIDEKASIIQHLGNGVWSSFTATDYVASGVHSNTANIPSAIPDFDKESAWFSKANNVINPLLIGLLNFDAYRKDETIELQWSTITEHNCKIFEIERSKDCEIWNKIGFKESLSGGENGHQKLDYTFIDLQPITGYNYYRLKQIDQNGNFTYSIICSALFDKLITYPSPVKDNLYISGLSGKETIHIRNMTGKQIREARAEDFTISINLNDLSDGIYHIDVVSDNDILLSRKIIINK
ncbi:MAG: T9SS type A sorting domain-containing protein [Flavobacteriia bacterium]|nr:T9SS type A sorting domain-containing protein [Flavobacteriia bacterium]OJX38518.1 MAG: hypothetical protein BGO87_10400 [Flavobacteriia bacterium 40-80]